MSETGLEKRDRSVTDMAKRLMMKIGSLKIQVFRGIGYLDDLWDTFPMNEVTVLMIPNFS